MNSLLPETPEPDAPLLPQATEADFEQWLTELLPGVRAALAQQGFAKSRTLAAFQNYLHGRPPASP